MSVPKPLIFIIDDERTNIQALGALLSTQYDVRVSLDPKSALEAIKKSLPDIILLDIIMPEMSGYQLCQLIKQDSTTEHIPVIFVSTIEESNKVVEGFAVGAVDFINKPFQAEEVLARVNTHLTLRQQFLELEHKNQALKILNEKLESETGQRKRVEAKYAQADEQLSTITQSEIKKWGIDNFIGQSQPHLDVIEEIRSLHRTDKTNVLVLGESGTGKELVARAIHYGSPRSKGPFVAVNCSAVPAGLADSAFFGSLKGSFTNSTSNQKGYFEAAEGGTLFLDEIGDMPLELQAKLLRVLEQKAVTPVGANTERPINVRVIAATNVNLEGRIDRNEFRQDLFFRLSSYQLILPSLRDRQQDIILLARYFTEQIALEMGHVAPEISAEAQQALEHYSFPGNIRELRNMMEYALIRCNGANIMVQHLPRHSKPTGSQQVEQREEKKQAMNEPDNQERILDYITSHQKINNIQCQKLLGLNHHQVSYLLKKMYKEGVIEKFGERRWSHYGLPEINV